MPEPTPLYVRSRRALLDPLEALREHLDALILVGAQAIYLHTGEVDEAIATETKDTDLAIDLPNLDPDPLLQEAMQAADFKLGLGDRRQPGTWFSSEGIPVDLLVPDGLVGGSHNRRAARIPPHGKMSARKVKGLEGAIVDHERRQIASLEPSDDRRQEIAVAGPTALLIAKLHKIGERVDEDRGRAEPKDAHDAFRLMREIEPEVFIEGFARCREADVSAVVTAEALDWLEKLFGERGRPGSALAGAAVAGLADADAVALRAAALAREILDAVVR